MNCLMQAGPNSTQHFLLPNSRKGRKTTTILKEKLARHHFIEFLVLKEKKAPFSIHSISLVNHEDVFFI